jgi:hypothetical protein
VKRDNGLSGAEILAPSEEGCGGRDRIVPTQIEDVKAYA